MQASTPGPTAARPAQVDPYPVLVVHNTYQQRGGEDAVVEAEVSMLRQHGHTVYEYRRSNDDIKQMPYADAALQAVWSRRTTRDVAALIQAHRPVLVHVHNKIGRASCRDRV